VSQRFRHRTAQTSTLLALATLCVTAVFAQSAADAEKQLAEAAELITAFTDNGPDSIPSELLARARGIAVIPQVFRGGFILGARRGRGVLSVRMPDDSWSNPAFVKLTGGSVGWQIGAESTDVVLVFANDNAVTNIATGKFTLGGEATAVAGPLRKQAAASMTFRAEVYGYLRSRGLYAGAAFQGARLDIDEELAHALYGRSNVLPLAASSPATPPAAQQFLQALSTGTQTTVVPTMPAGRPADSQGGARTFPLPD
jgi:lipid-binding SYLF domain-containing protein